MQGRKPRKRQYRNAWSETATPGKQGKPQDATRVTLARKPRESRVPALNADDIARTPRHATAHVVRHSDTRVRVDMTTWRTVPHIDAIFARFDREA